MFEKHDKELMTARILITILIVILAIAFLVDGIILAIQSGGILFLRTVVGWFICWVLWILARLYLSYLCDIKLIRNKLYGESNDALEPFLKSKNKKSNSSNVNQKKDNTDEVLKHWQQLLSSGIITAEEYEILKKDLMEGK